MLGAPIEEVNITFCDWVSSFPRDNLPPSESAIKCLLYAKTFVLFGSLVPKPFPDPPLLSPLLAWGDPPLLSPLLAWGERLRRALGFCTDEYLVMVEKDDDNVCVCLSLVGWGGGVLSSSLRAAALVLCLNFSTGIAQVKAVFSQRETASSRISKITGAGIPYENKHTYQRCLDSLLLHFFPKFSHNIIDSLAHSLTWCISLATPLAQYVEIHTSVVMPHPQAFFWSWQASWTNRIAGWESEAPPTR